MGMDPKDSKIIYVGMADNKAGEDGEVAGMITISRDGGETWNEVPNLPERIPHNLRVLNNGNVFVYFQWDGLYKSTNKGVSWTHVSDNVPHQIAGVVAADPRNENNIYFGVQWKGLWKSTNAGNSNSWVQKAEGTMTYPKDISVASDGTVWVIQDGSNYGVWKSTDSGETFTKSFAIDVDSDGFVAGKDIKYEAILIDPEDSNTIYISARDNYRPLLWKGVGVYVTRDGGNTWNPMNDGMFHKHVVSLDIDKEANLLYAGAVCHGMFKYDLNN